MAITRRRTTVVEEFASATSSIGSTQAPGRPNDSGVPAVVASTGEFNPTENDTTSTNDAGPPPPMQSAGSGTLGPMDAIGRWIGQHILSFLGGVVALVTIFATGAWYVSKFDSGLADVRADTKDVKSRIEKVSDEVTRHGTRLDYLERKPQQEIIKVKANSKNSN